MSRQILKKKKILITGASGFVGRALFERLQNIGAEVIGVSRGGLEGLSFYKIDVLNYSKLESFVKKHNFEICFHLAGESLVETGQKSPYKTFITNTQGTLNILELARKNRFERVVISSTSHVYGKNKVPYFEGYTPRPTRPYETSKAATDLMAQSYADTFGLPVLIPRFVNIYGPRDLNFNRLIPKTIKSVLMGKKPTMWGGDVVREFLYIDDAIDAYLNLAVASIESIGVNRVFNFGSGITIPVRELIKKIIDLQGNAFLIDKVDNARVGEIRSQYVSSKKAKRLLGWSAKVDMDSGLLKTLAWYKDYFGFQAKS